MWSAFAKQLLLLRLTVSYRHYRFLRPVARFAVILFSAQTRGVGKRGGQLIGSRAWRTRSIRREAKPERKMPRGAFNYGGSSDGPRGLGHFAHLSETAGRDAGRVCTPASAMLHFRPRFPFSAAAAKEKSTRRCGCRARKKTRAHAPRCQSVKSRTT